ncbi:hypothetical protein COW96_03190 [Candidatus Roizmanbacteria bacterium CG22_combo_CG10-13_8_21_14_all_33_16]|uniref:Glycosyltransferase 2-like domain-containing protein n=3 Tax=Candidatus Roizmaniibacteriota TaxID=1752723 RepID=A0A2H0C339_9BACT|nr:MAG: hypothetical protein COW96_03190 [Candidatus Roizmanbacteria bacterium CG22_combo_CG10-13_8_21_14_all_33_16]
MGIIIEKKGCICVIISTLACSCFQLRKQKISCLIKLKMLVSVVIPCFNEEKVIAACLTALVSQKTSHSFEVIVVNNNSTDQTVEIIKKFRDKLDLRIAQQKKKGRGPARKMGFQYAKGNIILSTDADTIVPPKWIETLVNSLLLEKNIAVTGSSKIVDCGWSANAIFNLIQPLSMRFYRIFFGHYWLSGFSFGISKKIYDKSGGFNDDINGLEDIDLSFKVKKIGVIKFIPNIPVIFSGRRFSKGLLKGLFSYINQFFIYFFYREKKVFFSDIR